MSDIKAVLGQGKAVVNGWLTIPSGFSAELMARSGYDSITIDLQHGVMDYRDMVDCMQALEKLPVTRLVRVVWNEPGNLGRVLDAGAQGIICPMINSGADAEAFVAACKYPPRGFRSNGPVRASLPYAAGAYQQIANDELLCIPIVETRTAVDNIDAILDVEGISGIYIGPTDLCFSMGLPPVLDVELPEVLRLYERLVENCMRRGRFAGMHCGSVAYALKAMQMGFRMTTVLNDGRLMAQQARAAVDAVRQGSGGLA